MWKCHISQDEAVKWLGARPCTKIIPFNYSSLDFTLLWITTSCLIHVGWRIDKKTSPLFFCIYCVHAVFNRKYLLWKCGLEWSFFVLPVIKVIPSDVMLPWVAVLFLAIFSLMWSFLWAFLHGVISIQSPSCYMSSQFNLGCMFLTRTFNRINGTRGGSPTLWIMKNIPDLPVNATGSVPFMIATVHSVSKVL